MPDLVNDPKYFGVNQPSMDNPLHDDDPSNDYMFDDWKANADLWREWSSLQDEKLAKAVEIGAQSGDSPNQTLTKLGFQNRKEMGQHAFTMYGDNGYFANQGAAADPGWEYNWATGKKRNIGTADKSARDRWESINPTEYGEYRKAQGYLNQGLTGYGQQANAEAFKRAKASGHFNLDPQTGMYYSGAGADDPGNVWTDEFGRARGGRTTVGPRNMMGNNAGYSGGSELAATRGIGPDEYRPYLKVPANNSSSAWGTPNAQAASTKAPVSDPVKLSPSNPASSSFPTVPGLKSTSGEKEKKKSSLTGTTDYGTLTGSSYAS